MAFSASSTPAAYSSALTSGCPFLSGPITSCLVMFSEMPSSFYSVRDDSFLP